MTWKTVPHEKIKALEVSTPAMEINVAKKTITFYLHRRSEGKDQYIIATFPIIHGYVCPLCDDPLYMNWQLDNDVSVPHRIRDGEIKRSLADMGHSSFRFFETQSGQGFHYDPPKDLRKPHEHYTEADSLEEYERPMWMTQRAYGGDENLGNKRKFVYINIVNTAVALNQIILQSVNVSGYRVSKQYGDDHEFFSEDDIDAVIERIENEPNLTRDFLVMHDIAENRPPMLLFNTNFLHRDYYDTTQQIQAAKEYFMGGFGDLIEMG